MHGDFFMDLDFLYMLALNKRYERELVKFNRFLLGTLIFVPCASYGAGDAGFNMAAQLLSAARNGNTRLVQNLINSGADVNYVDSTGVSVVCTAVMNNDTRAVQVLQMYGADASQCDRQIKNYRARNNPTADSGLFAGLPSTHKLVLTAAGVGVVIAGLLWATDAFDSSNGNSTSSSGGSHSGSGGGSSGGDTLTATLTVPYSPAYLNTDGSINTSANVSANTWVTDRGSMDFNYIQGSDMQNYLLIARGYNLFANEYNGQRIFRSETTNNPLKMSGVAATVGGGEPAVVALITENGINPVGSLSRDGGIAYALSINGAVQYVDKYLNFANDCDGDTCEGAEINQTKFDLSGTGTVINTESSVKDNNIAKIVAGWLGGRDSGDLYGFMPYGRLAIYRTGDNNYNYQAMKNAVTDSLYTPDVIANAKQNSNVLTASNYDTVAKFMDDADGLSSGDVISLFQTRVDTWYGTGQGAIADDLFAGYNSSSPIIINSVGAYNTALYPSGVDATFENYAPVVYSGKINKNFMSVVAVQHSIGTTSATSVSSYADGTGSSYGKIRLSEWYDPNDNTITYRSRTCGFAGVGINGTIDPWCFAAPGETSEYAVSALAGAVANLQKSFSYMSNQQIFNLLALTADGPYLAKDSSGSFYSKDDLVAWLKTKFTISAAADALTGDAYIEAFKNTFGYGLINLERATTPNTSVYYYSNGNILSSNGETYWRSAQNSTARSSSVFGARGAVIPVSFYDVLTDTDNTISVPRVWNMDLSFGNDASRGFYLGDTLAELKTHEVDNTVSFGNFKFGFARSERYYDDNMNGLDNLSLSYENSRFGLASNYQHYLTDGAGRFGGLANPVLSLVSNAVTSGAEFKSGRFALSARGFSGVITNEDLLENDPAVSNNFAAAKLGDVMGAESGIKFNGEKLSLQSNIGTMHENGTVLGSQFMGLLNINAADTHYVDTTLGYNVNDNLKFTLRGTLAWTRTNDVANDIINGISELKSNAFAAGVRFGNFDISASMPLALTNGALQYSYANFIVDENDNLQMRDAGVRDLDLTPECREYRFNLAYRHKFGDWTDGAFGLIYRIHPNNTDAFGNESIFMMKLSHRLGI